MAALTLLLRQNPQPKADTERDGTGSCEISRITPGYSVLPNMPLKSSCQKLLSVFGK